MFVQEELASRSEPQFDLTVQSVECQLRLAVKYGFVERIYNLVTYHNADINSIDYKSHSSLVISILQGHNDEITELLCQLGADVNFSTDKLYGYSPLHFAAERNQGGTIEVLIEHGAHRDPQTITGCTPLHLAAMSGNVEAVRALCLNGADVDIQEWYKGFTPLHYAITCGHPTVVQLLLELNASLALLNMALYRSSKEILSHIEDFRTGEPRVLEKICLDVIRKHFLWPNPNKNTSTLPLPTHIKRKILLADFIQQTEDEK